MSFWDRFGAAVDGAVDKTKDTIVGHAMDVAREATDTYEARGLSGALMFGLKQGFTDLQSVGASGLYSAANSAAGRDNANLMHDLGVPLDYVQKGLSTYAQVVGKDPASNPIEAGLTFSGVGLLFNHGSIDDWRQAWDNADLYSPGQAGMIATGMTPQNARWGADPESVAARKEFFTNTFAGKATSGTADFLVNVFADPLVLAGKAGKARQLAEITVRPQDAGRVVEASRTLAAGGKATGRTGRQGSRLNDLLRRTDGLTASQMAAMPEFQAAGDASGSLAYFFERINKSYAGDTADAISARWDAKRDLIGSLLGDSNSIARLKGKNDMLAHELKRTLDTPPQTRFVEQFDWFDAGKKQLVEVQDDLAPEIQAHADRISTEMDRLERIMQARSGKIASTGTSGLSRFIPGSEISQYGKAQRALDRAAMPSGDKTSWGSLASTVLHTGFGSRPVRIIQAAMQNRLPGHVNVVDPVQGMHQMQSYLSAARYLAPEARRRLMDDFARAATQGDRKGVVLEAEKLVEDSVAKNYGLKPDEYEALKKASRTRRQAWVSTLQERLYSAAPDAKHVHIVDPETDEIILYPKPLLRSQIEDHISFVDPMELDKTIRSLAKQRTLEDVVTTGVLDKMSETGRLASDGLMWATRLWKDSALFRLAYPIRVQVDTQMRLVAYMGALNYAKSVPGMASDLRRALLTASPYSKARTEKGIERGLETALQRIDAQLKKEGYESGLDESLRPIAARMLQGEDGAQVDFASEMARSTLNRARSSGRWSYIDPNAADDADWGTAYLRAVNYQIRNSPTAMAFLQGRSVDEVKRMVRTDPAVRKEWAELAGSNDKDVDQWLGRVQAHVDHYLPTSDVRDAAVGRELSSKDIQQFFMGDRLQDRMVVHGESYSPLTKDNLLDRYQSARETFYKWASDMPESVIGRSPLYAFAYKKAFRDIAARYPGETLDTKALRQVQIQADRHARREIGRVLFDSSHTSNLASHFRYVAPFFAAWEDMMKKWGQLLYDKPQTLPRLSQAWFAPNNAGLVVDSLGNKVDAKGNHYDADGRRLDPVKDKAIIGDGEYFLLPAKILGKETGIGSVKIRKDSFNIAFQGEPWWLPGMGPLVQVPANQIMRKSFPDLADSTVGKYLFPYGLADTSTGDQVLPGWVKQAKNAFGDTQDYQNTYSLLLAQETSKFYAGERTDKPTSDEIAAKTRNWFILRAVTANVSPVSVQPSAELQFYVDQAHIYRTKYGQDWQQKFDEDFPDYYRMRLSLSANETGIVATDAAYKAASDPRNRKLIAQQPGLGWLVVGPDNVYGDSPDNQFSQGVYTWGLTQKIGYGTTSTFRSKRDNPNDALREVEVSAGWDQYIKTRTTLNLEMEKRGFTSLNQKGAEGLKAAWDQYVDQLKQYNRSWADEFSIQDKGKAVKILNFAKDIIAQNPRRAKDGDMQAFASYLQARQQMRSVLAQRSSQSLTAKENADLAGIWEAYTRKLGQWNIGFEQALMRGLDKDDLSEEVPWP